MFNRAYFNNFKMQISTVILSYPIQHVPLLHLYSEKPGTELDKTLSLEGEEGIAGSTGSNPWELWVPVPPAPHHQDQNSLQNIQNLLWAI